jgi:hypothetical protein
MVEIVQGKVKVTELLVNGVEISRLIPNNKKYPRRSVLIKIAERQQAETEWVIGKRPAVGGRAG